MRPNLKTSMLHTTKENIKNINENAILEEYLLNQYNI
jgi:hypothetical protein